MATRRPTEPERAERPDSTRGASRSARGSAPPPSAVTTPARSAEVTAPGEVVPTIRTVWSSGGEYVEELDRLYGRPIVRAS